MNKMINIYKYSEKKFEKMTSIAITVLGNSITFFVAFCLVIYWLTIKMLYMKDIHNIIGDVILGVAFLSLFVIQKSFNRFSASLHLKVNELVLSHAPASNAVINSEEKTEFELNELSKEYSKLAEKKKDTDNEKNQLSV